MNAGVVLLASLLYLAVLFALASWGDRRADAGRSPSRNAYVYTLSLGVYCTAWTFYGSVGLASRQGLDFLPIYLGPTLAALLFGFILERMLRVAKAQGITSIADFLAARYGKSGALAGLVTIVAVLSAIPYIALQLKAVAASVDTLIGGVGDRGAPAGGAETALFVTLLLALFGILFGTRQIDATAQHQGMVVAVAFESLVKLLAFIAVGIWVTYGMFDGFADILGRAAALPHGPPLTVGGGPGGYPYWFMTMGLAGLAFLFLDRQFQVAVLENLDEAHLRTASWLLPAYLLAINLFVLPIALGGVLAGHTEGDLFLVLLPLVSGQGWLALLAYIGGLSAATAMIIVGTVALSTMISNDLVMPLLLRLRPLGLDRRRDVSRLILAIRRAAVVALLLLGFAFFRLVGEYLSLVGIGLVAFCGVAQFGPPILAGLYWREANLAGAMLGLLGGVGVWAYTLVLPTLAGAGVLGRGFVDEGPWGVVLLRPEALFGLAGLDPVSHAALWSLGLNLLLVVLCGLLVRQGQLERLQAVQFVEVEERGPAQAFARGAVQVAALRRLLIRFLGQPRADAVFAADLSRRGTVLSPVDAADAVLLAGAERQLARAIGAASARAMVNGIVRGEAIGPDELMRILDETSQAIEYSQRLEQKSQALERATAELRLANERLRELDRLKDEFLATVSHELRTPLTSIRSFSEILLDAPELEPAERERFLTVIVHESERLTRLINDILDLAKIESGRMEWQVAECELGAILEDAVAATHGLFAEKRIALRRELGAAGARVRCDRDRMVQVLVNLLANAAKFVPAGEGEVRIGLAETERGFLVRVEDNGPGVPGPYREAVFEKFRQLAAAAGGPAKGTGLGLAICRQIVEHAGGRIWAEDAALGGAAFCFTLPAARAASIVQDEAGGASESAGP